MSSHREAPEIAKDPVADSTDVYAFVSPDRPDTVTMISNYIPLEPPDGGPNFYCQYYNTYCKCDATKYDCTNGACNVHCTSDPDCASGRCDNPEQFC